MAGRRATAQRTTTTPAGTDPAAAAAGVDQTDPTPPAEGNPDATPEAAPETENTADGADRTDTHAAAAERRRDAYHDVAPGDRSMVDALLAERLGYQQRGLDDRVGQVDEQLERRGYHHIDE